jgi:hypothetical protein
MYLLSSLSCLFLPARPLLLLAAGVLPAAG